MSSPICTIRIMTMPPMETMDRQTDRLRYRQTNRDINNRKSGKPFANALSNLHHQNYDLTMPTMLTTDRQRDRQTDRQTERQNSQPDLLLMSSPICVMRAITMLPMVTNSSNLPQITPLP